MAQPGENVEHLADPVRKPEARKVVALPEASEAAPRPVFYRLDSTKITFTEYRWGTPSLLAIPVLLFVKAFRIRVQGPTDDPPVESLNDFEVPPAALPIPVRQRLAAQARELTTVGFRLVACHAIDDVLHSTRTYSATFAHPTLPAVARLHNRIWAIRTPPKDTLFTEFLTAFPNGEYLWSLSSKPDMLAPPSCRIVRREGAQPLELWKAHQQELAACGPSREALPASSREQVRAICGRLHTAVRDFHLQRGVFAPLTRADEKRISSIRDARHQAKVEGSSDPEILTELDRLQKKQTGWRGTILMLIVTMFLFLGVGLPGQFSSLQLLILVPVLLFHECGHYVAMRASGYRNLRMFFIPGFGAAVSGQHFNVPGWKKTVVSLMGPVPGIIVGIPLGLYGAIWGKPLALDAALLMLILNGFNLLPVLPLDGGHIVHTVLFCRHHVLDVLFRVGAAFILGILAAISGDRVLLFVAVAMFVGLPLAFGVAKVAGELRREGLEPASPDSQSVPPAVAERIIAKLKAGIKMPRANKMVAQQVLQVFETLNTRPPGWAASIGLMLVHVLSFMAAVVFAFVFTFAQHGAGGDLFRAAAQAPKHSVAATMIRESPAPQAATEPTAPQNTILATFAQTRQAAAAYNDVVPRLELGETASLLGDTLLIRLPSSDDEARERWLADLQPRAADVFVDGGAMRAIFRFSGIAPDEVAAQSIADELQEYFRLPLSEALAAPWSSSATPTPDQRLARKTYIRLQSSDIYEEPAAVELRDKLSQAQRRGNQAEVKDLGNQLRRLHAELERKRLQRLADDSSSDVDAAMARRYLELYEELKPAEFYKAAPKEFALRLGQVSTSGEGSDAASDTTWARSGYVSRTGLLVEIEYVSFCDATSGVAALITWLNDKRCALLRYDVSGELNESDSEEDEPQDGQDRPDEQDEE